MMELSDLTAAIEVGDRASAVRLTQEAVDRDLPPQTILDAMTAAMTVVGGLFQRGETYVPDLLIAARAMKEATVVLEPLLVAADIHPQATAVIGTVKGDLHDIGKNLVGMMWRGASIEVIDLGANVPPERYVAAAKEYNARLVGLSALLTTTMGEMRNVVAAIRAASLDDVKVIVGGAPVTAEFAREIGADGYAADAAAAVEVAKAALTR
jgi:5-methyltetrahydrofolate--homocysteine methyltransferase